MTGRTYVLISPARNEQATIEITIKSVLAQTILPREWIIVSDRSTDRTDDIVRQSAANHDFIRLVRIEGTPEHSFAAVVRATETGVRSLTTTDYSYIGLLDADVSFAPDYYERLIGEFERDPELGLAGGLVLDVGTSRKRNIQNLNEIAGAPQFFTRKCFEVIGGLLAIPEGGWDAITCVRARMNGFKTATFPNIVMDHLKPRNVAKGNLFSRNWQLGVRDHALAAHPLFEIAKCCSRCLDSPPLLGALSRLTGFAWASVSGHNHALPADVAAFTRAEQLRRMRVFFKPLRHSPVAKSNNKEMSGPAD